MKKAITLIISALLIVLLLTSCDLLHTTTGTSSSSPAGGRTATPTSTGNQYHGAVSKIINGADANSATTYWVGAWPNFEGIPRFHIAFYGDGTGRITGSTVVANSVFRWVQTGDTTILFVDKPVISWTPTNAATGTGEQQMESLTEIFGSIDSGSFNAHVNGTYVSNFFNLSYGKP
jgi:hypothetical protein